MMRAAIYRGPGVLNVENQPDPSPGPGEIVINVHACGICGSDLHAIDKGWAVIGQSMGHEVAGVVAEVGAGVQHVSVGDRVTVIPAVPCGSCDFCVSGSHNLCSDLKGSAAGYAEQMLLPAGVPVFPLPQDISFEEGALLEPLAVAVRAVRLASPGTMQRCLVVGLGTIGQAVVQVLRSFGVTDVIGVDMSVKRLDLAAKSGASTVIDASAGTTSGLLREHAGGGQHRGYRYANVDVVFECSGSTAVMRELLSEYVKPGGTVVMVALFEDDVQVDANPLVRKEVVVRGSYAYTSDDGVLAAELMRTRRVDLSGLVSHVIPLEAIDQALAAQHDKDGSVKVVVSPR